MTANRYKERIRFAHKAKFEILHAALLPTTQETGLICTTNRELFFTLTKHTWIGNSGDSCHIANKDTRMYDITNINKLVQGSLCNMKATKRVKFM